MADLISVPLAGGGSIVVETSEDVAQGSGVVKARRSPGEMLGRAAHSLDDTLQPVAAAARAMHAKLREAGPDEVVVEFGVQLTAEVGAVITRTAGECNLKVTLRWERGDERGE